MPNIEEVNIQELVTRALARGTGDNHNQQMIDNATVRNSIIFAMKMLSEITNNTIGEVHLHYKIPFKTIREKLVGFTTVPQASSLETILTPFGIPRECFIEIKGEYKKFKLRPLNGYIDAAIIAPHYQSEQGELQIQNDRVHKITVTTDIAAATRGGPYEMINIMQIPEIQPTNGLGGMRLTIAEQEFIVIHAGNRIASESRIPMPINYMEESAQVQRIVLAERTEIEQPKIKRLI